MVCPIGDGNNIKPELKKDIDDINPMVYPIRGQKTENGDKMNKTILFSPVGMTDPIRYFKDGAMLNIIRNYAPDIVYLYMLIQHRDDTVFT